MRTIKHWTIKVTWSDGEEEYERVRNLNSDELKLWLIKKVLEDDIGVVLFFQEECDD